MTAIRRNRFLCQNQGGGVSQVDLENLLEKFRESARDKHDKGRKFERLIKSYLKADPKYKSMLEDVWLWDEWPDRWGADIGIDIVAREKRTNNYWAIQCKFFEPNQYIQKKDIDSFLSASGKKFSTLEGDCSFTSRFVFSTSNNWSSNAEKSITAQGIPVNRMTIRDLAKSSIDWKQFDPTYKKPPKFKEKKKLLKHQKKAIEDVMRGFKTDDRGKLIMACGTGKTFTALKLAEKLVPDKGRILFLAPSISLISQSLEEWSAEASKPFRAFVVCSDSKVGKDEEDMLVHDLAYPATTNTLTLTKAINAFGKDERIVIFSTYQSLQVISDAQKAGLGEFDLIVCDEAHRTTGVILMDEKTSKKNEPSGFLKVHDNDVVQAKKRLYMTATPRIYAEASKTKADRKDAILHSMDNKETFGEEFHRLDFGHSIEKGLLSDYKVLIVTVEEDKMSAITNSYNEAYNLDDKKGINIKFATKIIGCWKGLSKNNIVVTDEAGETKPLEEDTDPMRRVVAFSRTIKASKDTTKAFYNLVELYKEKYFDSDSLKMVDCELDHVDGTMNALERIEKLDWLKKNPGEGNCHILSNARCLSEGVDVPALDSVVFMDTRKSIVDIVQAVGRAMRKTEGKEYGYVILPVCIPAHKLADYNNYIDGDEQFRDIWKVLKALRAHDESLVDEAVFRDKVRIVVGGRPRGGGENGVQTTMDLPELPLKEITEAVYAAIPKKLGDLVYWSEWAKDVADITNGLVSRINELLSKPHARKTFDNFLDGLQKNINPEVSEEEAIEMLAQHVLTRPIFDALFKDYSFTNSNPVSNSMQEVIEIIDKHQVGTETEKLEKFYGHVTNRVENAKSKGARQEVIRNLYDTFFKNAFRKMTNRLGITYTPVEIVDFIINSAEAVMNKHFKSSLNDHEVQILDPFTGMGTFMVRLLQSGFIKPEELEYKYENELLANEVILLAYYVAAINIETAYYEIKKEYKPFKGITLTDSFQVHETPDLVQTMALSENSERVNRQKEQAIRVIIGNPPYSIGQRRQNDNNKNLVYENLDLRIKDTYAVSSSAKLLRSLRDSYIRSIRLASDLIGDKGVVAFITNNSFLDSKATDGLRKSLIDEFSYLYIFNLRGNARAQDWKREGSPIFETSRISAAISIMVKDPDYKGSCKLFYHDIGDYLSREKKIKKIKKFKNINGIKWKQIRPNYEGDWINQRDPAFEQFIKIGDKNRREKEKIFETYSSGIATNRDSWAYNFSKKKVSKNMREMIDCYNEQVSLGKISETSEKKISWSDLLKKCLDQGKKGIFDDSKIVTASYRPFCRQWLYFDKMFNEKTSVMPKMFPTPHHENIAISITGQGAKKSFSTLVTNCLADLNMNSPSQYFPLYYYEKAENIKESTLNIDDDKQDEYGYIRCKTITDWALEKFRSHYQDRKITKENIFWYVYGVFHSTDYRERFAYDLQIMLPHIPLAKDFWTFSKAGKKLGKLHLNYENVTPYPLKEERVQLDIEEDRHIHKMVFEEKENKNSIIVNDNLTLRDIPSQAHEYVVDGKSAVEWIVDRYVVKTNKDSGIVNNPNDWESDNPEYIPNLLKRAVTVGVESIKIIDKLPPLEEYDGLSADDRKRIDARIVEAEKKLKTGKKITPQKAFKKMELAISKVKHEV